MSSSGMSIIYNWNKGKWIFKDVYELGYPYYHIHPYKQKTVHNLVNLCPNFVTHLIIFGSSVHSSHMFWKDLDVCVVGE